MGRVSPNALFHRRNDRHDSGRIFLRSAFFQLNAVRVVVFRFRAVLSDQVIYLFLYFAGENQMDRLGLSSVLIVRLCCRHEFLSHGAGGCPGQLFDLSDQKLFTTLGIAAKSRREENAMRRVRVAEAEPLHKCAVCGATELSDPNLDFRVARDGEEHCMAHLPKAATPAR